jgi:hypothetical protein
MDDSMFTKSEVDDRWRDRDQATRALWQADRRERVASIFRASLVFVVVGAALFSVAPILSRFIQPPVPTTDENIEKTIERLQSDSRQAVQLLSVLQNQISQQQAVIQNAQKDLGTIQEQRRVLQLTEDEKRAIQTLIRRQPTPKEIFTSTDFWFGRFMLSLFFFVLGILIGPWVRRRESPKHALRP